MLVLSRKSQERIIIGEGIEVTVLGISGNRVRLGIKAPPDVPILRNELERLNSTTFSGGRWYKRSQ